MATSFRLWSLTSSKQTAVLFRSLRHAATVAAVQPPPATPRDGESFMAKNARLNRPMSPHLTIYKPQLTSMLSISHRGTGLGLYVLMSGFGIGMMALPASYPYYLQQVADMQLGFTLIYAAKFLIVFPFMFHTFNGVRHLTWDLGYGFSLRSLYKSGYSVVGLSLITSIILAYL